MKNIIYTFVLLVGFAFSTSAQSYTMACSSNKVVIKGINNVKIQKSEGTELEMYSEDYDHEQNKRAQGLRLLGKMNVSDNTGIGLSVESTGTEIHIVQVKSRSDDDYVIKVPSGIHVEFKNSSVNGSDVALVGLDGEVSVALSHGDLMVDEVTGPISAKVLYGDVDVVFGTIASGSYNTLTSTYGHVDLTLPGSTKANFAIKNTYGETFTNVDLKRMAANNENCKKCKGRLAMNGGGDIYIDIKANYSDVYIRAKE